ncbi:MAG: thioredoxin family protein [Candidatus Lokiarchaeota archaeon]|nr:thioredoxin family protein [Candidatus Lokiarchaeota archaeon]
MLKKIFIIGILIMACCGGNNCKKSLSKQPSESDELKEIVIQFSADWCAPCRQLKSIMKSEEMKNYLKSKKLRYYILDIEKKDKTTKMWVDYSNPTTIPLVVKYSWDKELKRWKEIKRFVGAKNIEFMKEWLKN